MVVRVMFNMTDAGKIRQTREMIITAVSRFEVYIFKLVSSLRVLLRLLLGPFSYKDERTFARSRGGAARTIKFEKSHHIAGGGGRGRGRRGRGIFTSTSATDQ